VLDEDEALDDEHVHLGGDEAAIGVAGDSTSGSPRTLKLVLMSSGSPCAARTP
jgi:hypothetical protein